MYKMDKIEELLEKYDKNIYEVCLYELHDNPKLAVEYLEKYGNKTDLRYYYTEIDCYDSLAHQELKNKNYEDALKHLLFVSEKLPDFSDFYYGIGVAYFYLKNYDKAIEYINKAIDKAKSITVNNIATAIEINKDFVIYYDNLGAVYETIGNEEGAKKCSDKYKEYSAKVEEMEKEEA